MSIRQKLHFLQIFRVLQTHYKGRQYENNLDTFKIMI